MAAPAQRIPVGRAGEEYAAGWLERQGFRIEARNWRRRTGEIDVIAWDGATLVFIEVKTRRGTAFGGAAEAVDARKQGRILRAAEAYVQRFGSRPPACRFDVLALDAGRTGDPDVTHLRDAFRPGWGS